MRAIESCVRLKDLRISRYLQSIDLWNPCLDFCVAGTAVSDLSPCVSLPQLSFLDISGLSSDVFVAQYEWITINFARLCWHSIRWCSARMQEFEGASLFTFVCIKDHDLGISWSCGNRTGTQVTEFTPRANLTNLEEIVASGSFYWFHILYFLKFWWKMASRLLAARIDWRNSRMYSLEKTRSFRFRSFLLQVSSCPHLFKL